MQLIRKTLAFFHLMEHQRLSLNSISVIYGLVSAEPIFFVAALVSMNVSEFLASKKPVETTDQEQIKELRSQIDSVKVAMAIRGQGV